MPNSLSRLHENGLIGPVELATIHVNYMAICAEVGVSTDDAATREIIARDIIQLHRRGETDLARCLAHVRKRLALAAVASHKR
jgi:hypothetical protein